VISGVGNGVGSRATPPARQRSTPRRGRERASAGDLQTAKVEDDTHRGIDGDGDAASGAPPPDAPEREYLVTEVAVLIGAEAKLVLGVVSRCCDSRDLR